MGSKLLPQALISIPRSLQLSQCPCPQKLCFSMDQTSRRFSSISTITQFSTPRVSTSGFGLVLSGKHRPFVVRAAEEPDAESTESPPEEVVVESTAENEESPAVEVEAEAEPRPPRKQRVKMGDIMGILNQRAVEASQATTPVPDIRPGDIIEVKWAVPRRRRKFAMYKGIVISKQNAGIHTTIRIRRIISGIGVEIVFPVYAPNIMDIKVLNHRKVRKAKLYYLRDKLPRFCTFK